MAARSLLERSSATPVPANRFARGGTPGIDGGGAALDGATRSDMQARFGRDFSGVRVHTNAAAAVAARSLSAAAYTVDRDIVFGAGRYAPQTPVGRRLLAHELAHVAQNDGAYSAAGRPVAVGAAHDPLEAAADRAADAVTRGAPVGGLGRASAPLLRRAPTDGAPALPLLPQRLPPDSAQIDAGELLPGNPKLMAASATYIARAAMYGQATVRIHAAIAPHADAAERDVLIARQQAVSGALQLLRVPAFAIVVEAPRATGAANPGAVVVTVPKPSVPTTLQPSLLPATVPTPLAYGPQPGPTAQLPSTLPPPVPTALPKISLDFELGPLTVKLPKELQLKLEKVLKGTRKLKFEMGYDAPAKFTLKLATEGLGKIDIALSSEVDVDTDKGVTTGKFGLTFSSAKKVCRAVDPAETQRALVEAGRKLNQSSIELQRMLAFDRVNPAPVGKLVPAGPDSPAIVDHHSAADKAIEPPSEMDLLGKAAEVAGAVGAIYAAAEKAKAKCKELSAVEVDLGYTRLLTPGSEKDAPKLPAKDVVGATLTIRF